MRIGVDFDNTIVCYDAIFHRIALERGLIPPDLPVNKSEVRNHLRRIGREPVWTEMQGEVYGSRMSEAAPYPGVVEFFQECRQAGVPVSIISHKTIHPFLGEKHDLHQAARNWLGQQGFFDPARVGLPPEEVFFELTKEAKVARIAARGCEEFIDDLPEFLAEPAFPKIGRILFDPNNLYADETRFFRVRSWAELLDHYRQSWRARDRDPAVIRVGEMAQRHGFTHFSTHSIRGGGNNRVYCVTDCSVDSRAAADLLERAELAVVDESDSVDWQRLPAPRRAVVKHYFKRAGDNRDRFASERAFYKFLWGRGIRRTPEPLDWDDEYRLGLFSFVEGRKLKPEEVDAFAVEQALEFIIELNHDRRGAEGIPVASEACFSIAEHLALVDRRLARLDQIDGNSEVDRMAVSFVRQRLRPTWENIRESIRSAFPDSEKLLTSEARILSPSDFGFHNALLPSSGRLRFLDFEYAGWDDPAKLLCDFFCQPQIPVSLEYWDRAVSTLAAAGFPTNARALLPAYKIKWCCIMLNEFLRGDRERRGFAQGSDPDPERKSAQLAKAARALDDALQIWKSA